MNEDVADIADRLAATYRAVSQDVETAQALTRKAVEQTTATLAYAHDDGLKSGVTHLEGAAQKYGQVMDALSDAAVTMKNHAEHIRNSRDDLDQALR